MIAIIKFYGKLSSELPSGSLYSRLSNNCRDSSGNITEFVEFILLLIMSATSSAACLLMFP